ncbi:MAG: hypothetical protein EOO66_25205 [Methylobacterium sp.]|nr:MAG: hypothetical protein EOO66_25205 [Methylobacterium sp.]
MIALTLLVCLHADPDTCRPERVAFEGSMMSCTLYGQAVAAEWLATHPKYRLKTYSCGRPRLPTA